VFGDPRENKLMFRADGLSHQVGTCLPPIRNGLCEKPDKHVHVSPTLTDRTTFAVPRSSCHLAPTLRDYRDSSSEQKYSSLAPLACRTLKRTGITFLLVGNFPMEARDFRYSMSLRRSSMQVAMYRTTRVHRQQHEDGQMILCQGC
jgi:hypothetical protein